MGKTLLIKVESGIIAYARKYSRFTLEDVARKTRVASEKLQAYESQTSEIPLTQLEKFSNVYKRPLAFFLLHKVPDDAVLPNAYRTVYASESDDTLSSDAYLAIRRARYVQSVIGDLADGDFEYQFPTASIKSNADELSGTFRKILGKTIEDQRRWSSPSDALRKWKDSLEENGVFVLQQSLPKDNISAFSLADRKPYVIVLNSADHEYRRIFSLFHEVGHILLHTSGICTPEDLSRNSYAYVQIEKFCNQFSASFLLPREDFIADPGVVRSRKTPFSLWEDADIRAIASRFKVSREVVLRKFLTLHYIEEKDYDAKRAKWQKDSEEFKKNKKKGEIKIPPHIKCLSKNGRAFTSLVLDRYHNNRITFSAAADILNIGSRYISRLEANMKRK